jgi:hypothetical protein
MKRRTLLQSFATLFAIRPFSNLRLLAQTGPAGLTDANVTTLKAIAEVVLPGAIGSAGRDKAVRDFVVWVRNYREGADRGHSYGASTLSAPSGPSPAARYPPQFAALEKAATDLGVVSLAALPIDRRRTVIESALNTPQPVTRLPPRPTGANLVADFMGLYFNSADGYDLAYNAAIARDSCRGLDGSDKAPDRLAGPKGPASIDHGADADDDVWRPGL